MVDGHETSEYAQLMARIEKETRRGESMQIQEKVTNLQAELAERDRALTVIQHNWTAANQKHNAEMNRMSEELAEARKDRRDEFALYQEERGRLESALKAAEEKLRKAVTVLKRVCVVRLMEGDQWYCFGCLTVLTSEKLGHKEGCLHVEMLSTAIAEAQKEQG